MRGRPKDNRTCDLCDEPHLARGMCRHHYDVWRRHGDPTITRQPHRGQSCAVEGCDKPHMARGYCNTHYHRVKRTGTPDDPVPRPVVARPPCTIPGCERHQRARGFCVVHYLRFRRGQDMTAPIRKRPNFGNVCSSPSKMAMPRPPMPSNVPAPPDSSPAR